MVLVNCCLCWCLCRIRGSPARSTVAVTFLLAISAHHCTALPALFACGLAPGAPWQQQQQQQQAGATAGPWQQQQQPGAPAAPWQQQSLQQPQQAPWQQAQQPVPGAPSAPPPWSSGALQPPLGHALNPHAHPHPHLAPPGPHAPPPGPGAAPWNVHSYPPPGGPHASAVAAALAAPPPDVAAAMGSGPNASSTPLSPHGAPYGQQQGAGGAGLGSGDRDLRSDRDRDRDRDWDRDRDRDRERDRDRDRDRGRGRDRERSYDERDRRDSRDGSRGDHSPRSRSKDRCDTPPSEPVNSMSFPPGLLPKLCYDKSKHSNPYEPLDPVDIEKLGRCGGKVWGEVCGREHRGGLVSGHWRLVCRGAVPSLLRLSSRGAKELFSTGLARVCTCRLVSWVCTR